MEADADGDSAVAKIERVRMALRAVANDRDFLGLDQGNIRGIVVIEICHSFSSRRPLRGPSNRFNSAGLF